MSGRQALALAVVLLTPFAAARGWAAQAAQPDHVGAAVCAGALGLLAVGFGWWVRRRARAFGALCMARGCRAAGLVPLNEDLRAAVAGAALAAGVAGEMQGEPTWGAAGVAVATLCAALRVVPTRPRARGPGRWQALAPREAFSPHRAVGKARPWGLLLSGGAALLAAAWLGVRVDAGAAWLFLLDASMLLPTFWLTGGGAQLPAEGALAAAAWLSRALDDLARVPELRVTPWGRVTLEGSRVDELRLLVMPGEPMPGVVGVEVGVAWSATPVGWTAAPEVLARVLDGSAAAVKLARDLPGVRALPGRRTGERVLRLVPRLPTRAGTVAVVGALCSALTDRRVAAAASARPAEPERRKSATLPAVTA